MCSDVFWGTKEQDHTFEGVHVSIANQPRVERAGLRESKILSEPQRTVFWTLGGGDGSLGIATIGREV